MSDIFSKSGQNNGNRGSHHHKPLSSANHPPRHHTWCCSNGNFNHEFRGFFLWSCGLFRHILSRECKLARLAGSHSGWNFRRPEIHGTFLSAFWREFSLILSTGWSERIFLDKTEFVAQLSSLPNRRFSCHDVGGWRLDSICYVCSCFTNVQKILSNTANLAWMPYLLDTSHHKLVSCIHYRSHWFPNDLG